MQDRRKAGVAFVNFTGSRDLNDSWPTKEMAFDLLLGLAFNDKSEVPSLCILSEHTLECDKPPW
jgi:hypothetical protein